MSQLPDNTALNKAEYSAEERSTLLALAHRSIAARLHGETLDLSAPAPHLAENRGAFTTLRIGGKLRGCIGYVTAAHSLYRTVAETAQAAAFDDPRFDQVGANEIPVLEVEISVMSPLFPIKPDEIAIGKHGLIVTMEGRRGLLLPQVPVEHGWNVETFLRETCEKAWLPGDAWEHGAQLFAFTAEIFADPPRSQGIAGQSR